jgi:TPR repeat protein
MRQAEQGLQLRCAFCREPPSKSMAEHYEKACMKRAKANDPVAMNELGKYYYREGNFVLAFEYLTKSAALGYMAAHYYLSLLYGKGEGVEMDLKKGLYHMEEAAIGGHPYARFNLGNHEGRKGRFDRAYKHFIIAAKLGLDEALEQVKKGFALGVVSKDDYAAALRGHQAAVDATKSEQREEAYAFFGNE